MTGAWGMHKLFRHSYDMLHGKSLHPVFNAASSPPSYRKRGDPLGESISLNLLQSLSRVIARVSRGLIVWHTFTVSGL